MKIALINFTYNKKSGIENVADNIIRQVDQIDRENTYILFVNELIQDFYITSPRIEKKILRSANRQIFKILWLLFVYPVYALIKGYDITVIFNCSSNFALSPFTKNIIYIHDLGELHINNKYDRKRMMYRKFLTLPVNKVFGNVFIAVSKSTRREIIEKLKIDEHKIRLIYNGTDESFRNLDKADTRKLIVDKYNIKNTSKIVIAVGRIDPVGKNLIKLIEAADIMRKNGVDFHLFLIGESNFPNSHLVPDEIEARDLSKYITLSGYVDNDELNIFYSASDLLVFPSIYEGFGLPLLEAMKCKLPVACSDIEVFHEVGGNAAVYFDPYNADDIAGKMIGVLQDASLRENLIEQGIHRQSLFTWDHSARKLLETFR